MSGFQPHASRRARTVVLFAACCVLASGIATITTRAGADDSVTTFGSSVVGSDGSTYSVTNHLTEQARVPAPGNRRKEWLLVWAGDAAQNAQGTADPDFLAVVDATRGTPEYGKVVNTVTIDDKTGNEPHHMQYVWHKGDRVYAGGIFSDTVYVFDVSKLPTVRLAGITLSTDTPCGSAPDAFSVLSDGTAYGTYMGGPDVSGPCTYTDGQQRIGNGFAGSPGELVHLDRNGRVLSEAPAASKTPEDAVDCPDLPPLPEPTCANPHGIAVREDLGLAVTSDFADPRILLNPDIPGVQPGGDRDTVRVFNITERNRPILRSVSRMPDGPRQESIPYAEEPRGLMETAVPHGRDHRGAFVASMPGGAVFYTPDITVPHPRWREVFDDATAFKWLFPTDSPTSGLDGGGWLQVSPDDRYLYHTVLTAGLADSPPAHKDAAMVYVLDIQRLLAAGKHTRCVIDAQEEITGGGAERDCPTVQSAVPLIDPTTGGPHWAAMDNFRLDRGGLYRETDNIRRIAVSNYLLATARLDGDHRVCMLDVGAHGALSLDQGFRDEATGVPCLNFNREQWPHGDHGGARPHGVLFVVSDADVR